MTCGKMRLLPHLQVQDDLGAPAQLLPLRVTSHCEAAPCSRLPNVLLIIVVLGHHCAQLVISMMSGTC